MISTNPSRMLLLDHLLTVDQDHSSAVIRYDLRCVILNENKKIIPEAIRNGIVMLPHIINNKTFPHHSQL